MENNNFEKNKFDIISKFNVAGSFIDGLGHLISYADICFLAKDYPDLFRVLKRIYMRLEHKLNPQEKEKMNNLFIKTYEPISKYPRCEIGQLSLDLEQINYALLSLLDKYKLLTETSERNEGII